MLLRVVRGGISARPEPRQHGRPGLGDGVTAGC